jgi:hypothetical protein
VRTSSTLAPLVRSCPLALVLASTAAQAAPATLFGRPVEPPPELGPDELQRRRAGFEAMLVERGLEVHGDIVGPPELFAAPAPTAAPEDWEYPPHRATIYLNFFGGEMTYGTNSAKMQSTCIQSKFKYPGFTGSEAQALAIISTFESLLAPYGVRVAYREAPPPELPYAMVMMGGRPGDIGMDTGILGVSCSSDCGDRWWRDTTLAFTAAAQPSQTNTLATTALHEAAHAFGLAHIDTAFSSPFVMHPYVDNSEKVWGDQCEEYNDATGGINCQSTHDVWCGGGAQNTHAELMAFFGPNSPDTVPPTVEILAPEDGVEVEAGTTVALAASVTDDHDGVGWKLMIYRDDQLLQEAPAFEFETDWSLAGLPAGVYRLRVQAIDHDANVGADEVVVYVGTEAPAPDASTGGDTGTGDESGPPPTTAADPPGSDASGASGDDTGAQAGEDGCSYALAGVPGAAPWLLVLAGLRRRRR